MTAREGAAFVQGVGTGMTIVGGVTMLFGSAPAVWSVGGIGFIAFGHAILRSAGGDSDR